MNPSSNMPSIDDDIDVEISKHPPAAALGRRHRDELRSWMPELVAVVKRGVLPVP
ncbi:hypothetical protein [Bradyrhizobium yuanmingense]|uniref:hypothetical protein n=1 Tax=Bradyrhizobium yuanmingense TaxID=108015 RepID=UPI001315A20D|nr:hypothetical protein [Bradyrhizobium yuanmingense]